MLKTDGRRTARWWLTIGCLLLSSASCNSGETSAEDRDDGREFGVALPADTTEMAMLVTVGDSTARTDSVLADYSVHLRASRKDVARPLPSVRLQTAPADSVLADSILSHDPVRDTRTVELVIDSRIEADMVELRLVPEEAQVVGEQPHVTEVNGFSSEGQGITIAEIWRNRTEQYPDTVVVVLPRCDTVEVRMIAHLLGPDTLRLAGWPMSWPPTDSLPDEIRKQFRLMVQREVLLDSLPNCCQ